MTDRHIKSVKVLPDGNLYECDLHFHDDFQTVQEIQRVVVDTSRTVYNIINANGELIAHLENAPVEVQFYVGDEKDRYIGDLEAHRA